MKALELIKNPTDVVLEVVRKERIRQITEEEYDPAHDDDHIRGQLADAAACYAAGRPIYELGQGNRSIRFAELWPWSDAEDKRPKDHTSKVPARIVLLVKAAALLVAEIERLVRQGEKRGALWVKEL